MIHIYIYRFLIWFLDEVELCSDLTEPAKNLKYVLKNALVCQGLLSLMVILDTRNKKRWVNLPPQKNMEKIMTHIETYRQIIQQLPFLGIFSWVACLKNYH